MDGGPLKLLRTDEVLALLAIGESNLDRLVREWRLPVVWIGRARRFRSDDVRAYIESLPRVPEGGVR
jgi:excisionase family DNA binding protein